MKHLLRSASLVVFVLQAVATTGSADVLSLHAEPVPIASGVPLSECQGFVRLEVVPSREGGVARSEILESFPQGRFEASLLASIQYWRFENLDVHEQASQDAVRLRVEFAPSHGVCEGSSISSTEPIEVLQRSPGCLGVVVQKLTPEIFAHLGLDRPPGGGIVSRVMRGSPAEEAGLRRMDILDRFNSQPVERNDDLAFLIARMRPGEGFEIIALRSDEYLTIAGSLGSFAPDGRCETASGRPTPP